MHAELAVQRAFRVSHHGEWEVGLVFAEPGSGSPVGDDDFDNTAP